MVNPINVNPQGISGSYGFGKQHKPEEKKAEENKVIAEQKPQVAPDKVLDLMAKSAVPVITTKTIDPSKYVDEASAKRIAGFMSQFEDIVAANLSAISAEFPGMSDSSKQALALSQVKA